MGALQSNKMFPMGGGKGLSVSARGKSGALFRMFFDRDGVVRAMKPRKLRFLRTWGGYTRKVARSSIKPKGNARRAPKRKFRTGQTRWTKAYARWYTETKDRPASPPGSPPYTHTGDLRNSIFFSYSPVRKSVLVGPAASRIDDLGKLHEYGGTRFGKEYPARPFMRPARTKANTQLKRFWAQSISR